MQTTDNNLGDTTLYDGCSFYFLSRRNNSEWEGNLQRHFLLHVAGGRMVGQFISTIWFNMQVDEGDTIDFVVLRLPQRGGTIHPNEDATKQLVVQRLAEAERHQAPLEELDFVILHKCYTHRDIANIYNKCANILTNGNGLTSVKYHDKNITSETTIFGISFDMIRQEQLTANRELKIIETSSENQLNPRITHQANLMRCNASYNNETQHNNTNTLYASCPMFEDIIVGETAY